jgi:hypothetical protein
VIADHRVGFGATLLAAIVSALLPAVFAPLFFAVVAVIAAAVIAVVAAVVTAVIVGVRASGGAEHRSAYEGGEQEPFQLCAHAYLRRTEPILQSF